MAATKMLGVRLQADMAENVIVTARQANMTVSEYIAARLMPKPDNSVDRLGPAPKPDNSVDRLGPAPKPDNSVGVPEPAMAKLAPDKVDLMRVMMRMHGVSFDEAVNIWLETESAMERLISAIQTNKVVKDGALGFVGVPYGLKMRGKSNGEIARFLESRFGLKFSSEQVKTLIAAGKQNADRIKEELFG